MRNAVIVSRAWAAMDELKRWDETEARLVEELGERSAKRMLSSSTDPLLNPDGPTDHSAIIWSRAAEIIEQHKFYVEHNIRPEDNANAIAAWRLVLRTRDRNEIEQRLRIAIKASAKVFPRCNRIFEAN